MNNSIVTLQYNDQISVDFTNDVWFNATAVAKNFGKLPNEWLRLESTQDYIQKLTNFLLRENPAIKNDEFLLSKTQRGRHNSGTWFHPKLAVAFARWLDTDFAIWCDMQIDKLLRPIPNALRDLPPQTLTPAMKKHINQRVNYLVKHQVGASYASLGKLIQETFNVNKRELILASKYREVCALLDCQPDEKALQGELLEPQKIEYQPPKGMVLIAESELSNLKKKPTSAWQNHATMILTSHEDATYTIQYHKGISVIMKQPENVMIGTPENIIRDLTAMGYHVVKDNPENKLETIVKIAQFSA